MAIIKSFTDIEQSKKLAKILPLESANMKWFSWEKELNAPLVPTFGYDKETAEFYKDTKAIYLPCWSLAALLHILPYPQLSKDKLGGGKVWWMVSVYPNDCRYNSCLHDNPVDACVEMILKLNELKML